jgi:acetyl-CoA carboxylase biotin carboxyl carrier protein
VAENGAKIGSPFDVQTVRQLVALMSRHDLSETDLREGELRIRLRRGPGASSNSQAIITSSAAPMPSPPPPPGAPPAAPADNGAKPPKVLYEVKSPTPGTFYSSSSPDAEAFVRVGSRVESNTVVCLIEAMKIFNEITAECNGVISEVLVENQQPVEYGQVLFRVDPTG